MQASAVFFSSPPLARVSRGLALLGGLCAALIGCESSSAGSKPSAQQHAESNSAQARPAPRPEFIAPGAADTDVRSFVRQQVELAVDEERRLLVYVGAEWCEPCRRLHDAVVKGELDEELAGVRFVEFDKDKHGDALDAAGYSSRLIPLIVVPRSDGSASPLRLSGSIKGPRAVQDNLMPRLQELLAQAP